MQHGQCLKMSQNVTLRPNHFLKPPEPPRVERSAKPRVGPITFVQTRWRRLDDVTIRKPLRPDEMEAAQCPKMSENVRWRPNHSSPSPKPPGVRVIAVPACC